MLATSNLLAQLTLESLPQPPIQLLPELYESNHPIMANPGHVAGRRGGYFPIKGRPRLQRHRFKTELFLIFSVK